MSESLSGASIKIICKGTLTNNGDQDSSTSVIDKTYTILLDNSNMQWSDTRTLAASASESIDLAGSLTSRFGTTLTFTKIQGIVIAASSANTNNVQVGGAASNQFINWVANSSDIVNIQPGNALVLTARSTTGFAVTAGTGDILKIANSGGTTGVDYDIFLWGTV